MFKKFLMATVCVAFSFCNIFSQETALPPNAALQYWLAFSFLGDDKPQNKDLTNQGGHTPPGEERKKLVGRMNIPLKYLHRGTLVSQCDWGIDVKADGPGTLLPHLGKVRNLARVGCVAAAQAFDDKEFELGITRILEVIQLSRHIGGDGLLIGKLVELAVENMALTTLAEHLAQLPRPLLETLTARLDALPLPTPLAETLRSEAYMVDYMERNYKFSMQAGSGIKLLQDLFSNGPESQTAAELVKHPENLKGVFPECREYYKELEALLRLPLNEFTAAEAALNKKYKHNVLIQNLSPAFGSVRAAVEADHCQYLIMRAAIQIVLEGRNDALNTVDPYAPSKMPFEYQKLADGFELTSALKKKEQRVSLRFAPFHNPDEAIKPPRPPKPEEARDF